MPCFGVKDLFRPEFVFQEDQLFGKVVCAEIDYHRAAVLGGACHFPADLFGEGDGGDGGETEAFESEGV